MSVVLEAFGVGLLAQSSLLLAGAVVCWVKFPQQIVGTLAEFGAGAAVAHEDGWYLARCLEVEVTSQGTRGALANLKEAVELYFEDTALPEEIEPAIIATVELSA